jgi:AcrR family transcriptional regulator
MVKTSVRRTVTDWQEAALSAIAAHGVASLSIPALARSLGVTKGSFYWHFRSLKELIDSSLERWEEMDRAMLEQVRQISDVRARLEALFVQSMERREAHALYLALSATASPEAVALIRRISERRLRFLVESYREAGLPHKEARQQAILAYSAYIGALHLRQQRATGLSAKKDLAAYVEHAVKTLIPRTGVPGKR